MAKKTKYIWRFKQAGKGKHTWAEYDLCDRLCSKNVLLSSLTKCRNMVKMAMENEEISSANGWTEENWVKQDYCVVINSGACEVFSFRRLEIL